MPVYDYYCEANDLTVEVVHPIDVTLKMWGEVCFVAQHPLGDTDPAAPVRRVITSAPGISVPTFNAEYKNEGFTKLVRREEGVYENVTAIDGESKYMKAGDESTLPHLHKKIRD